MLFNKMSFAKSLPPSFTTTIGNRVCAQLRPSVRTKFPLPLTHSIPEVRSGIQFGE